jgi:hypothetical protein
VHVGLESGSLEIGNPAIGGDQREIGTEQHLVLELAIGPQNEFGGKVFRASAQQIDVNIGLMQADGKRFVLPWPRWMRDNHGHVREIGGDVVDMDRV